MIDSACHDKQAQQYDKNIMRRQGDDLDYIRENYSDIHAYARETLAITPHDRLLDIGIGTGLLEEAMPIKPFMCGVDISEKMLQKARAKQLGVELRHGSFLALPYDDQWFHKIVSCFAFHHLSDPEKVCALDEMNRVLREQGLIVLADFMYEHEIQHQALLHQFTIENRRDMLEEMKEENFTNIAWMVDMMNEKGFDTSYQRKSTLSWVVCMKKVRQIT